MADETPFCVECGLYPTDAGYDPNVCDGPDERLEGSDVHELGYDVVMRDGHRGQYLTPTMVDDMESLGVEIPADVRRATDKWLASWSPSDAPDPTESEVELVTDFTMYSGEYALSDLGYSVRWDDGYVIYRLVEGGE